MRWTLLLICVVCVRPAAVVGQEAEIERLAMIWDQAPHNAFTDLTRFKGRWFCAFREGQGHVSHDGKVRILVSDDGDEWQSAALLTSPGPLPDLRDAKLSVTPGNQLMAVAAAADRRDKPSKHQTYAWFSDDGMNWTDPTPIGEPDYWLWRVTWHKGKAYAVGYQTAGERHIRLYRSDDGRKFDVHVPRMFDEGYPNETSLWFDGDTALCLWHPDGNPNGAILGRSKAPQTELTWHDLGTRVGGPHMIRLSDGRFVVAGRRYDNGVRTALMWLEGALESDKPALREFIKLPSVGDTSYPGLVQYDGQLWFSYYASHEGKAKIYLARLRLAESPKAGEPESRRSEPALAPPSFPTRPHLRFSGSPALRISPWPTSNISAPSATAKRTTRRRSSTPSRRAMACSISRAATIASHDRFR